MRIKGEGNAQTMYRGSGKTNPPVSPTHHQPAPTTDAAAAADGSPVLLNKPFEGLRVLIVDESKKYGPDYPNE